MAKKRRAAESSDETIRVQVSIPQELIRKIDHIGAETKESRPEVVERLLGPALDKEWNKIKADMGL